MNSGNIQNQKYIFSKTLHLKKKTFAGTCVWHKVIGNFSVSHNKRFYVTFSENHSQIASFVLVSSFNLGRKLPAELFVGSDAKDPNSINVSLWQAMYVLSMKVEEIDGIGLDRSVVEHHSDDRSNIQSILPVQRVAILLKLATLRFGIDSIYNYNSRFPIHTVYRYYKSEPGPGTAGYFFMVNGSLSQKAHAESTRPVG